MLTVPEMLDVKLSKTLEVKAIPQHYHGDYIKILVTL